jgi:plastocyanin
MDAPMAPARWTLARSTLVAFAVLPMVYITIFTGLAWLGFGPVPYFLITMAVSALALIWWPNRWLGLVPGVVAMVAVIGDLAAGASGDPGILRPDRTVEFTFWWLQTLLAPATLVAGIAHFRQTKRGAPARPTAVGVGAVVFVLALWLGGAATALQEKQFVPAGAGSAVGLTPDVSLNLTASGDQWQPASLTIPAGKVVRITVHNADSGAHVFNQEQAGLRVDLPAGSTKEVWLRIDAPGTLQYYCELHAAKGSDGKWAGMVGALTVT